MAGGNSGGNDRMDPTLANPIVLNTSINATLFQSPQPWWANNTISTFVTAIVTILAVYLGQRWSKSSERERDLLKARKRAYSDYISLFAAIDPEEDWPKDIVARLWKATIDAGEHGNLELENVEQIENFGFVPVIKMFKGYFGVTEHEFNEWLVSKGLSVSYFVEPSVVIRDLYAYIIVLEILQRPDTSEINKKLIIDTGQEFFPIFRSVLLGKSTPWWRF